MCVQNLTLNTDNCQAQFWRRRGTSYGAIAVLFIAMHARICWFGSSLHVHVSCAPSAPVHVCTLPAGLYMLSIIP